MTWWHCCAEWRAHPHTRPKHRGLWACECMSTNMWVEVIMSTSAEEGTLTHPLTPVFIQSHCFFHFIETRLLNRLHSHQQLHNFTFPYSFTHSGGNTCSPTHSLICTKWWKTSGLSHSHSHNMRHITTEGMALSIFHTEWYAHSLTYSLYTCTEYATSDFQLHSFTHLHRVEGTLTSSHTFLTFGAKLHFQHSVRGWSTEWTRVFVYKSL